MMSFQDWAFNNYSKEELDEALLIIGDQRRSAYPKFGHIMALAGGAGSGKGFVLGNVIGFTGKVFDVDQLKTTFLKNADMSRNKKMIDAFEKETGRYFVSLDLGKADDVYALHQFFKNHNIQNKRLLSFFMEQAKYNTMRKSNVIFDVTLDEVKKLKDLSHFACEVGGYLVRNFHIVWVLNDYQVAINQNKKRERQVPHDILLSTHSGASMTMKEIISNSNKYRTFADGDIWVVCNKVNVDSEIDVGPGKFDKNMKKIQSIVLKRYTAVKVKDAGKPAKSFDEIGKEFIEKINSYVPSDARW